MEPTGVNKPLSPPHLAGNPGVPANWRPRKPPRDWRPALIFLAAVAVLIAWWRFKGVDTGTATAPKVNSSGVMQMGRRALTTPGASADDSSPAAVKSREITAQDVGKPGDPALNDEYRDINQQFYAGKLPTVPVLWEDRLAEIGPLIAEGFTEKGLWTSRDNQEFIMLNTSLSPDAADTRRVLCHEIVHEYLYSIGEKTAGHGPKFQAELLRLSQAGAFEGIPAAEGEKASLKAWLESESARLESESAQLKIERQQLDQERAALDREGAELNQEVRELNQRISTANAQQNGWPSEAEIAASKARSRAHDQKAAEFNLHLANLNTRTQNYNAAVANFNQSVGRYNLMIAYPDGLDEENAMRVKAPPEQ